MSYDIHIINPDTQETLHAFEPHMLRGGTYCPSGTSELWLNVTYNYSPHYRRVLGPKGIRVIYGMPVQDARILLQEAANKLGDDVNLDYWRPTEGNAKAALLDLIRLADLAPLGAVFAGD